ncbi:MAG: uL15 family ribosomal protein [Candidatus Thermoplasmatota archaeon]|nr:uL15 family ribosomal protein [Candidatus Thermoplasmatota archaeon]
MVSRTSKFRGRRTHGAGKKGHRGAGKRGGKGNAGLHKHRYTWTVDNDPDHFGRHGFKRPQKVLAREAISTINVRDLDIMAKANNLKEVNLAEMGIDKLLGSGKIEKPLKIIVDTASPKAVEKVEAAGGEVVLSDQTDATDKT